jgi:hypothetical protein
MVISNNAEERLARIEDMLQSLQREAAVLKTTTAKIIDVVQAVTLAPVVAGSRLTARRRRTPRH